MVLVLFFLLLTILFTVSNINFFLLILYSITIFLLTLYVFVFVNYDISDGSTKFEINEIEFEH